MPRSSTEWLEQPQTQKKAQRSAWAEQQTQVKASQQSRVEGQAQATTPQQSRVEQQMQVTTPQQQTRAQRPAVARQTAPVQMVNQTCAQQMEPLLGRMLPGVLGPEASQLETKGPEVSQPQMQMPVPQKRWVVQLRAQRDAPARQGATELREPQLELEPPALPEWALTIQVPALAAQRMSEIHQLLARASEPGAERKPRGPVQKPVRKPS